MSTATATKPNTELASSNGQPLAQTGTVTTKVAGMIQNYLSKGTLHLPSDYSAENALKQAWLTLQTVKDKDQKPVLQSCEQSTIVNALLDMVIQGLNPAKTQCYFIAYGKQLVCQRSYHGDMAVAKRSQPGIEFYHGVVRQDDEFDFELLRGKTYVAKHRTSIDNLNKPIIAAYCGVTDSDGVDLGCEIMTIERIKKSWSMSKTYQPGNAGGTHAKFEDDMALRTVIRKRALAIVRSSSDAILLEAMARQDAEQFEGELTEEIESGAHQETITLAPGDATEIQADPEGTKADQPALENVGF